MQEAIEKDPCENSAVLQPCQASCDQVIKDLEALVQKLPTESTGSRKPRVLRLLAFRNWKEDVEALQQGIQGAKINLILHVCTWEES